MASSSFDRLFHADSAAGIYVNYNRDGQRVRFRVPKERPVWWEDYCSRVEADTVEENMGEMVPTSAPVVISLTIHSEPSNSDELPYDTQFIETMVLAAQTAITEAIQHDAGIHLIAAVLETGKYSVDGMDAFTVTIQFPLCRMYPTDQKRYIRPILLDLYGRENLLNMLTVRANERLNEALRVDVLDGSYPLYGSSSLPGIIPNRQNVSFYDHEGRLQINYDEVAKHLFPHNHPDLIRSEVSFDHWHKWLPAVLSIRFEGGEEFTPILPDEGEDAGQELDDEMMEGHDTIEQKIAREMMDLISKERYKQEIFTIRIGKALFNVFKERDEGLELWKKYALGSGSTLLEETEYEELYRRFTVRNYFSELTLQAFAKEDNVRGYKNWYQDRLDELLATILKSPKPTEGAVSRAVYHMTCLEYTYVVGLKARGTWYRHNGSFLEPVKVPLFDLTMFRNTVKRYEHEMGRAGLTIVTRDQQREYEAIQKNAFKVIEDTDTVKMQSAVTKQLQMILGRKTSKIVMNENPRVFALNKGLVFESYNGGYSLRRGFLEDFVTFHSFISYRRDLYEGHPDVIAYDKFELRLYGNREKADYMTMKRSKDMRGANHEKAIELRLGRPHTGKTTDAEVDKHVYGTLQFGGSTTMITGKRGESSTPTPDLAHTNYMRRVTMEDPETTYNSGRMNEGWLCQESGLSGRHSRFLHDDGEEVKATAAISIGANDPPLLSPTEQLRVRIVVIKYPNRNLSDEEAAQEGVVIPQTEEEQWKTHLFPKLHLSEEQVIKFAEVRLWRMIQVHDKLDWSRSIARPQSIVRDTDLYWQHTDPYHRFCRTYVRKNTEESILVDMNTLYKTFKDWNYEYAHASKKPDFNDFRRCIKGVLGYPHINEATGDEYYTQYMLYDSKMEDFINETFTFDGNPDEPMSVAVAYDAYKRWITGADIKPRGDRYTFLNYMKCLIGGYDPEINAFRGPRLRI